MTITDVEFYVGKGGIAPTRKTGDAGFDFYVPEDHPTVLLAPGKDILINTHIRSKLAENIALVAFNKSGIATKKKLQVGACVVDRSYQGEIHIHVFNWGSENILIGPGDKLVQFVPIGIDEDEPTIYYEGQTSLEEFYPTSTERGEGGFGSTGDKK